MLAKLYDSGCKTEKDLKALSLQSILKIPDIPVFCDLLLKLCDNRHIGNRYIGDFQNALQAQRLQILFGFTAGIVELCQHLYFLLQSGQKQILLESRIVPNGDHCEASWEKQIPFFMNCLLYTSHNDVSLFCCFSRRKYLEALLFSSLP